MNRITISKETGSKESDTVEELMSMWMDQNTKATGKMIESAVLEHAGIPMEIAMRDSG